MKGTGAKRNVCLGSCVSTGAKFPVAPVESAPMFNGLSAVEGQYASSCQISSKSVTRLQTHGDLTVLIMAAVRHLGFVKFEFF